MCGICGFITNKRVDRSQLKTMNDYMVHRGPNDSGEEIFYNHNKVIGLAHRRLSIMDLSMLGHQPMHSSDGNVVIVYNGEIYNFQELKNELSFYKFFSNCDTEVILAAYQKWGIECLKHFNGMFALAIYDIKKGCLFLARDRVGKKPLYYWKNDDDFVFASECKPIISYPYFQREININVLNYYLCNEYIQAPDSIYRNMYKLEPGNYLVYKENKIKIFKYWDSLASFERNSKKRFCRYDDTMEQLDNILNDAVKKRMVADVPVGVFLSGGIDSSLISAIARKYSSKKLKTFSIGFTDENFNEATFAKQIANYLGTEHNEAYISSDEAVRLIADIPKYYDEPFADRSQVPTMLVSMLAKKQVDVALTGDGADEFYCGYSGKYTSVLNAQKFNGIGKLLSTVINNKVLTSFHIEQILPRKVLLVINNSNPNYRTQFSVDEYEKIIKKILLNSNKKYKFDAKRYLQNNWQEEAMLVDQVTYLPSVLCKVDRASMRYSLECRSPFLDYRVLELSYKMPQSFKYDNESKGKKIVKDLAYKYVPRNLLERPKHGFGAPVDMWLKNQLKDELQEYTSIESLKSQGIFIPENTHAFVANYLNQSVNTNSNNYTTALIWRYFIFQKWYNYYIK